MLVCCQCFVVKLLWLMCTGIAPVSSTLSRLTSMSVTFDPPVLPLPLLSFEGHLKSDISRFGKLVEGNLSENKNEVFSPVPSPPSFAVRNHRLIAKKNKGVATGELVKFFVESSPGWNVYIFYDHLLFPVIAEAVRSCFKLMAKVTLLECEVGIKKIKSIIKANRIQESLIKIIVLCGSSQTEQLFEQIRSKYLESPSTHWFVILQADTSHNILPFIREGTQVSFATRKYNFKYQLYNTFLTTNNSISSRNIGWWSWSTEEGSLSALKTPLVKPLDEVYNNFGGRQLTAAVIENWPFWHLETVKDGSIRPISGLDLRVLVDISEKLNFTFKIKVMPPGSGWGSVKKDGNATGAIGEVHRHSSHLVINEMILTENRELAVDFTYPYLLESKTLISPAPKKTLKEYAVFTPFVYEVWILLVIVTLLVGPIVRMIVWIKQNLLEEINGKMWNSLSDVSFIMFRILLQTAPYPPTGLVFALMFISWYFFCLLAATLYADVMISTLVVPSYEKPIDSLWDLLNAIDHRGYKVIMNCKSNNKFIFGSTKQKIYRDIWKTFDSSLICIKGKDEIMDKVLTGKYVTVSNRMGGEVRVNVRGRERYHIARNEFYAHGYGIACPNGSPYREAFQRVILPLMWSGLVQKYTNDELRKARKVTFNNEEGPEPISLLHLQGGFFMLVFGNIAASAVLLVEWIMTQ